MKTIKDSPVSKIQAYVQHHTLDTLIRLERATGKTVGELIDVMADKFVDEFAENKEVIR